MAHCIVTLPGGRVGTAAPRRPSKDFCGFRHFFGDVGQSKLRPASTAAIRLITLNRTTPEGKTLNREFEVTRWLGANEDQIQWNKKEEAYLLKIVKALDDAGIRLLVGSDAGTWYLPPGNSTHREVALLVQAGMSPESVLKAATVNAAETLEIDDEYGTIETGKIADLVVVETNPLENIGALEQPVAVIKAGQWISGEDIQKLKDSGENPSSFYVSFGRLLEDILGRALRL